MRVLLIVNPAAGRGRAERLAGELANVLSGRGHSVKEVRAETPAPGALARWFRDFSPRVVCIAGGDGTVSLAARELAGAGAPRLALLPCGTANQLARELHLPGRPRQVARLIEGGRAAALPLGRVNDRVFLFNLSAGFDGLVCRHLHAGRRGALGFRGYLSPVSRAFLRYRPPGLTVELDSGETLSGGWALVGNIENYGGVFRVAPLRERGRGLFHVIILPEATRARIIRAAWRGLTAGLAEARGAAYRASERVKITSHPPAPVQADGEYIGETPVAAEAGAGSVEILVP